MKLTPETIVAEICMYGNHGYGFGFIARCIDGHMIGDGEQKMQSATSALWTACSAIGPRYDGGKVRVFAPGGRMMADADLNQPGYFGSLKWVPATVIVISAEAIEAAAAAQAN